MKHRHLLTLAALVSLTMPVVASAADTAKLATVKVESSAAKDNQTSLDGVVEAVRQSTLSTQVPGAIVALHVKAGDRVRAGQELLRIDARAAQQGVVASSAQVDAAQAALTVASKDLERQRALLQKQYISQAALDRAQAQRDAAQAQVLALQAQTVAAKTQSGFFVINAPYNGVISEVPVTLGDMALPGRPLITLHDPTALRITASLPQALLGSVSKNNQGIGYELPGVSKTVSVLAPAQVQVLPTVDPGTHTTQIRLTLPSSMVDVKPGMFARIWVPANQSSDKDASGRFYLPASAILRRAEVTAVYVIGQDGQPRLRQVRLGRATADRVEILSGLRIGDLVAADPQMAAAAR